MMRRFEKFFPRYAWFPVISIFVLNLMVYYGARLFMGSAPRMDMTLPIDGKIPFCAAFIAVYILAYLQWAVGYIVIGREDRATCRRVWAGAVCAKLICLVIFIALPTRMARANVSGSGVFEMLTRLIYWADEPECLFPSIHCLESWIVFRCAIGLKRVPKWYVPAMGVFTVLVFMSTLMVKQHVLVDVPAGIIVAEAGLYLARKLGLGRVLEGRGRRLKKGDA